MVAAAVPGAGVGDIAHLHTLSAFVVQGLASTSYKELQSLQVLQLVDPPKGVKDPAGQAVHPDKPFALEKPGAHWNTAFVVLLQACLYSCEGRGVEHG